MVLELYSRAYVFQECKPVRSWLWNYLIWILQFRKESSNESLPKHHKLFESVVLRIERKEVNPSTSVVVRNVVVEDDIGKLSLETSVISSNQPNRRGWRQFQTDWWAVNSCWRFSDQHFLTSSTVGRSKKRKIILEIEVGGACPNRQ